MRAALVFNVVIIEMVDKFKGFRKNEDFDYISCEGFLWQKI